MLQLHCCILRKEKIRHETKTNKNNLSEKFCQLRYSINIGIIQLAPLLLVPTNSKEFPGGDGLVHFIPKL